MNTDIIILCLVCIKSSVEKLNAQEGGDSRRFTSHLGVSARFTCTFKASTGCLSRRLSGKGCERAVWHVCAQNSFSTSSQEPHTCFAASGSGNLPSTHTDTQISGRSKTVNRAQISSWAHFRFLQRRCLKYSRSMTHACPCWQRPLHWPEYSNIYREGHRPMASRMSGGFPLPSSAFSKVTFQVCKYK